MSLFYIYIIELLASENIKTDFIDPSFIQCVQSIFIKIWQIIWDKNPNSRRKHEKKKECIIGPWLDTIEKDIQHTVYDLISAQGAN